MSLAMGLVLDISWRQQYISLNLSLHSSLPGKFLGFCTIFRENYVRQRNTVCIQSIQRTQSKRRWM